MQLEGIAPDRRMFVALGNAAAAARDLEQGRVIHRCAQESGYCRDSQLATAILNMYGKCGDIRSARVVFDAIAAPGEIDVVVGTALVAMYGRVGSLRSASNVFLVMPEKNTVTWNTMIAAYAQNGHHKEALGVYWRMLLDGQHRPSKVTFLGVFQACQSPQFLIHGRSIHSQSTEKGLSHDTAVATTIVSMYGKCGNLDGAREVFAGIQNRDSACWTAMIAAFAVHSDPASTLELFQMMLLEGIAADGRTFMGMLDGCTHTGRVEQGCYYFGLMSDHWIVPEKEHYGCLADLLGRAGWLLEAEDFIKKMPASVVDDFKWMSLLGACKMHGDVSRAERAAKQAVQLNSRNSAAAYVALSSVYVANSTKLHRP
ncbi:hypothetical protein SELMODRAFT_117460 [Selaginella moellendorffii]|uniref:Pentacotripeptide-repeat region of PRORP domain-containing protein n=1 Tax=Selaginella moellendorffii TaxID=88036 RepID=D8SI28_SELML|nr:hypothetical protein SELMODRAFT_117460 [Selaginella moellendorffii]